MEKKEVHVTAPLVKRMIVLIIADVMSVLFASVFAIWVRFDFSFDKMDKAFFAGAKTMILPNIAVTLLIFWLWRLYKSVWRYASATELFNITGAVLCSTIAQALLLLIFKIRMPKSYPLLYMVTLFVLCTGVRFSYRALRLISTKRKMIANGKNQRKVMVIGAGAAGNTIIKEIDTTQYLDMKVVCIIDDGKGCWGKQLRGVPIVGGREKIVESADKYEIDEIIIAIPSASRLQIKEIIEICKETGCNLRILPAIYQLINGDVSVSNLRKVEIEDLLGREPVSVNTEEIIGYVKDKVILVTGGGGSIGSELCRQLADGGPKQLIIVDIYENNAYEIQQELKRKHPELNLEVLIASVRNEERIDSIFNTYRPNIVYHAAAHKHVPLMEDSPHEAIKNNVFGTYKTALAADKYGVEKFVLISTDKAVNPTNIMGASKRLCEMVIQTMNETSKTNFVAVRFGNVLGSNGSVIPLFKKQIAEGGPVTVTHPDIIRYFMTIPEAVSLVLQCGAYANGGEIFVLDMGNPVKILDLAKNLIKLSGYKLGEDIEIVYTGLRPGEKMYEELLMSEEGLKETSNKMIFIGKPLDFDREEFKKSLVGLKDAAEDEKSDIRKYVSEIVTTYHYESE